MNTPFSLDRAKSKVFPESISYEGNTFFINADFRNILRIMRMSNDNEILEVQKPYLIVKWFFKDEIDVETGLTLFRQFLGERDDQEEKEPEFDFEFDAKEIYVSFLTDYGIDLFETGFMHWNKFITLLSNLSEDSPFQRKLRLRFMDLSGYKGKELVKRMEAKEAVQIPVRYTKDELIEMAEFEAEWG